MISDQFINTVIEIYSGQSLLLIMQLINMAIALIIAKSLIEYAIQLQGKSLSHTMRFLAYAFLIMAGIMIIRILSALPWFMWDPVEEIAIAFFLFATAYAVWTMKESIHAYSQLKNRR